MFTVSMIKVAALSAALSAGLVSALPSAKPVVEAGQAGAGAKRFTDRLDGGARVTVQLGGSTVAGGRETCGTWPYVAADCVSSDGREPRPRVRTVSADRQPSR